jgi:hypothetical protein
VAVALVGVAILAHARPWSSTFLSTIVLITTLEIGYLIGLVVDTLWLPAGDGSAFRNFLRLGHGRLSHH